MGPGDYSDLSYDQDVDSDGVNISVEGPGGPGGSHLDTFHFGGPHSFPPHNVAVEAIRPIINASRIASLSNAYSTQSSSPDGSVSGEFLASSLGALDLEYTTGSPQWGSHPSHANLPRLDVPPRPSFHTALSAPSSLPSYDFQPESPYGSPSAPNPAFLSAGSGNWSPHPHYNQRPRSQSASGNLASYSLPLRPMSPGVSEYASDENYFSDASSVFSEEASTSDHHHHINPQLLSNHALPSASSSGYTSTYSNESSPLPTGLELPAENSAPSSPTNRRVASARTRSASQKRRKKDAKFLCSVPGCGGSFTARHNLINHENAHNGVRNYVCEQCDTAFITSAVLKRHTKTCKRKV